VPLPQLGWLLHKVPFATTICSKVEANKQQQQQQQQDEPAPTMTPAGRRSVIRHSTRRALTR
jgi:hypothetical protein